MKSLWSAKYYNYTAYALKDWLVVLTFLEFHGRHFENARSILSVTMLTLLQLMEKHARLNSPNSFQKSHTFYVSTLQNVEKNTTHQGTKTQYFNYIMLINVKFYAEGLYYIKAN